MRFERALCVFNPVAGPAGRRSAPEKIRDRLLREVGVVHLHRTESANQGKELALRASAEGYDLIAVLGGDGTVNEVVQGLAGKESPTLLVLGGGTANVLTRELGLPADPLGVIAKLRGLIARRVRLGVVDFDSGRSRFFLLMCGAGLDAEVAAVTTSQQKSRLGVGAFWLQGGAMMLRQFPQLRVAAGPDGGSRSRASSLVVISKSRSYGGGLVLTPGANLLADRFESAEFTGTSRIRYCGYLLAVVSDRTARWPGIRHAACAEARIEPTGDAPVHVQLDGEIAGRLPASVRLASETLRLLLPRAYGAEPAERSA